MVLNSTTNTNDVTWLNHVQTYNKCPHCEKGQLDTRVKRGFLVKYLFVWMNVKRYECNTCGKKSYVKKQYHT